MPKISKNALAALTALSCILGLAGQASGQDTSAAARYGAVRLKANFRPDPHVVTVAAGGADSASSLGSGCAGYISNERPDYELNYVNAGEYALGIYVRGDVDTTLVVNDPAGQWSCNDDFNARGGQNPGVVFAEPSAGSYDIWVGSYDSDGTGASVELVITEIGAPWDPLFGTAELTANFSPDPFVAEVRAGGQDSAASLAEGCVGFLNAERPDYALVYSNAGEYPLGMFVDGTEDSTLVVEDPSGRWFCNDDFEDSGGHNPGVVFDDPVDGTYNVWVGAYAPEDTGETVTLMITERGSAPWDGASSGPVSSSSPGTQLVASGTGFLVSRTGHVLTNHHVIGECSRMTFQIRGEVAVEAALLSSNQATDLALLKTPLTTRDPARFRDGPAIRLGEEVVVFGFPLLGDLSSQGNLTNGIISALSGLNDDLSRVQMTAQIQPGNSGGPTMDRSGDIVGVVVETANDEYFRRERGSVPQNVNFAIRDSLARSFLDTNNVSYEIAPAGSQQLPIADIAERAKEFTGVILCYR